MTESGGDSRRDPDKGLPAWYTAHSAFPMYEHLARQGFPSVGSPCSMALRICLTSGIPSMYSVAVRTVAGGPARRAEAKADLFSARDVRKSCYRRERGWRSKRPGATEGNRSNSLPGQTGRAGDSCALRSGTPRAMGPTHCPMHRDSIRARLASLVPVQESGGGHMRAVLADLGGRFLGGLARVLPLHRRRSVAVSLPRADCPVDPAAARIPGP
jgi:hypothetical protein